MYTHVVIKGQTSFEQEKRQNEEKPFPGETRLFTTLVFTRRGREENKRLNGAKRLKRRLIEISRLVQRRAGRGYSTVGREGNDCSKGFIWSVGVHTDGVWKKKRSYKSNTSLSQWAKPCSAPDQSISSPSPATLRQVKDVALSFLSLTVVVRCGHFPRRCRAMIDAHARWARGNWAVG